ncbi:MAG: response regulator [Candidatus Nitrosopolaris sp.]
MYDLVKVDVKMPVIDGFSLYEKIKKSDGKVIICFLTAAGDAYYETLKKGYPDIDENCIIRKPVDNDSLLRQIKSVL